MLEASTGGEVPLSRADRAFPRFADPPLGGGSEGTGNMLEGGIICFQNMRGPNRNLLVPRLKLIQPKLSLKITL